MCIATVALATILVMVLKVLSSEPQSPLEKKCEGQQQQERRDVGKSEQDDGSSVGTSSSSSDEESEDEKNNGALVLASENAENGGPKYGNISVANSSEVHFGNKTFYQGPVTIKQFVYANGALESGENSLEQIKDKVLEVPASVSNPAEKSASSVKSAISARNYSTLAKGIIKKDGILVVNFRLPAGKCFFVIICTIAFCQLPTHLPAYVLRAF